MCLRPPGAHGYPDTVSVQGDDVGLLVGAIGETVQADLAWTYHYPLPAVAAIADMVAFYNEKVDITVDGVALGAPEDAVQLAATAGGSLLPARRSVSKALQTNRCE